MSITSDQIWAASPTTARGAPTPLSSDAKGERIAYASNKSIFVRSIDSPAEAKQYTGHTTQTTVARFAPSGFYVASGDVSGSVRVWDAAGAETTKGEYHIIAGRINDIAWDGDSARIIAVGEGKERFGHCITADSGNSCGEISGHSSQINCVAVRQQRPLRAATGSDDTSLCFLHGAPFKFNTSVRGKHSKFIYGTQFSPDGAHLVTVGADSKIWLYDGKTGEPVKQIGAGEHRGSIFGVSWAADSRKLATCSGDQTVKIWDVEAGKCTRSWRSGGDDGAVSVSDQQLGVTWPAGRSDGLVISVDLEGNLNYFQESSAAAVKVVRGHQKAITAAASAPGSKTLWTGSYDGRVRAWDMDTGAAAPVDGTAHSNYVCGLAAAPPAGARVYSAGWDDSLRTIDAAQRTFAGSAVTTDGQPRGVAVATVGGKPYTLVATAASAITIYDDDAAAEVAQEKLPAPPTCVAASGETVAVGTEDKTVRVFRCGAPGGSGAVLADMVALTDPSHAISALAFSPDGARLAVGLANGKILVYARQAPGAGGAPWSLETSRWSAHSARVTSVAWSPDGAHAVSGALDTHVFVWSIKEPGRRVKALNAHKEGVASVLWPAPDRVISCGADAAVKAWKVESGA